MQAFSPDGRAIVGTYETCPGCAGIQYDSFTRAADGSLEFEYDGGTEMFYDAQKTVMRKGQRVFLDEDGASWTEKELVLRDVA